jgi:Ca2+-binding EF-hand superfamily protein
MTTPIDARIGKLFDLMDADGDGHVTWTDYQRTIDRFVDGYELEPDDRESLALWTAYQTWWLELRRHANDAEQLSRDEFVPAMRAAVTDTSRANLVDGLSHALFDVVDTDDDGLIERDEFARLLGLRGITDSDAMDVFDGLDTDGDGSISRQEYVRSWREFFRSDDPTDPGSRYFGRL